MGAPSELSLPAELLLLAIDPERGGLLPRRRRRFRRAFRAAGGGRRQALRELREAGLARRGGVRRRIRLTDPAEARRRFQRLRETIAAGAAEDPRDVLLLALLAYSGLLAGRLTKGERRRAARMLWRVLRQERTGAWDAPLSGEQSVNQAVMALGRPGFDATTELLDMSLGDIVGDLAGGDGGGGGDPGGGGDGN
ncbi:MAG TPA: hypothetical protein VF715_16970 [Thermoleophilaceae bacterium]